MKEYIGKVCLDLVDYIGKEQYSDGPIEDELLEIVKNIPEEDYVKVINEKKNWPVLYHLSKQRWNIIGGIPVNKTDKVLEIGAGCGAVTGILSEKAEKVTCIELSKKRSLINAYRNQKRDNIEIKVGNFETVHQRLTEKYDVITLIGVFEYAQSYISSPEPFVDFLKMIEPHLSENGRVAIAIENKYGLKYWAGCKEDHLGTFFSGLEGYSPNDRVRTFGKGKLEQLIKSAGFENIKMYYPYPDYKLPTHIYSDDYLPKKGELVNNMRNYDNDRMYLFNEKLVFDNLIEENMFPFFSNSYLAIAERKEKRNHG